MNLQFIQNLFNHSLWFSQSLYGQFIGTRWASLVICKMFCNTITAKAVMVPRTQDWVFQNVETDETNEISINCGRKPFLIEALYVRRHISHTLFLFLSVAL
jgi:hypothetical protein